MRSTTNGNLNPINECYLDIPIYKKIILNNLPEISDSKTAVYNSDSIIGRSSPLHTYVNSDTRNISVNFKFVITKQGDEEENLNHLRAIQSCTYPREGSGGSSVTPFIPPVICKLKCGNLLANNEEICVILQNYTVNFPLEPAWHEVTFCPYVFQVSTTWWVVYTSEDLPHANRIVKSGR